VDHHSGAFVGIDTSKLRNALAVAEEARGGEVRYLGEIDTTEAAMRKLVAKLAAKYRQLTFCYEAGPTGYGLFRLIKSLGYDCIVVAPSLIRNKIGTWSSRAHGAACPQLAKADVPAFGRHSGFDPTVWSDRAVQPAIGL
jgi:transposase